MKISAWVSSSLVRQFPLGPVGRARRISLAVPRGGQASFQACVRVAGTTSPASVGVDVKEPGGLSVRVRRVGCVPVLHHNTDTSPDELDGVGHIPGYVPDPLFDESTALAAPGETTAFWITVRAGRSARAGRRTVRVRLSVDGDVAAELVAEVCVAPITLQKRRDFHVTHWFYADAICDAHSVEPFEKAFWPICERYMRNYAAHGSDVIYVPVFTPPLDGVKRPTQLLKVRRDADGQYRFDWRDVKRWVETARRCGIRRFEWTHLFTQWGAAHAIRIYEKQDGQDRLLWPPSTRATSKTYRGFLAQFLPQLEKFLRREKLMNVSHFHVSDEPHGDEHLANYRKARALLAELAPWMKVMDALSDIRFGRDGLTDMPIPSIRTTLDFAAEGISSWTYFCCGPRGRYLNRLMDTPLAKIRASGWLFYRFGVKGFLHWGYNYWYKRHTQQIIDPFTVSDGLAWPGWAYGDTFVVYPGPDGPIDSIRWEVFAESLQDYALLQTLGVEPKRLSAFKTFEDFPKGADWYLGTLRRLLAQGR
jgi:glycosyl hydrolase family 123